MVIKAKKSLGQHWLDDQQILDSIANLAEVGLGDVVLEVGPGHGSLTKTMLKRGAQVTSVELDSDLVTELQATITSEKFNIVHQDILKFNLTALPKNYKVVANIPYYLTSNLIRVLCESANPPQSITLLVQKEVAERICAEPGGMSLLSVSAQLYYECNLGPIVPAEKFSPRPKVDSRVVNMKILSQPLSEDLDNKLFFRIVKAGFSSRRKTLHNSLAGGLRLSKPEVKEILGKASITPDTRAQELSLRQWLKLYQTIKNKLF